MVVVEGGMSSHEPVWVELASLATCARTTPAYLGGLELVRAAPVPRILTFWKYTTHAKIGGMIAVADHELGAS